MHALPSDSKIENNPGNCSNVALAKVQHDKKIDHGFFVNIAFTNFLFSVSYLVSSLRNMHYASSIIKHWEQLRALSPL